MLDPRINEISIRQKTLKVDSKKADNVSMTNTFTIAGLKAALAEVSDIYDSCPVVVHSLRFGEDGLEPVGFRMANYNGHNFQIVVS